MAKSAGGERLDPQLEELIQIHVRRGEMIRCVCHTARKPDLVSVHLMDRDLYEKLQQSKMPRVRNSGGGRTLSFERENGEWRFVSEGFWIT